MYLRYYSLAKEPFQVTPDPEFLFLSRSHKEALGAIVYGIDKRKGFIAIVGEVGVGKTTILRSYLERIDLKKLRIIYLFNANISFEDLLKTIYRELGIEGRSESTFEMVNHLHGVLIEEYRAGRNVVLAVDEAQNMPVETLENLRMLSNLETSTEKLLQILLIGQPELDQKLSLNELRQFKQRIAVRSTIHPLSREESLQYIRHRLTKAGAANPSAIFADGALEYIVRHGRGIPRTLNTLCGNSLIAGFGSQKRPVPKDIVKEVVADLEGKKPYPRMPFKAAAAALLVLAVCIAFWISPFKRLLVSGDRGATTAVGKAPAATLPAAPTPVSSLSHPAEDHSDGKTEMAAVSPEKPLQPAPLKQPEVEITAVSDVSLLAPLDSKPVRADSPRQGHPPADEEKTSQPTPGAESPRPPVAPTAESPRQPTPPDPSPSDQAIAYSTREQPPPYEPDPHPAPAPLPAPKSAGVLDPDPLIKVVKAGDTLSHLSKEVYGFSNDTVIGRIQQSNPQIKDVNKIWIGDVIYFPPLNDGRVSGEQ